MTNHSRDADASEIGASLRSSIPENMAPRLADNHGSTHPHVSRLHRLAELFQEAWNSNQHPQIEEFLSWIGESERPVLLHELLTVEFAFLRRTGRPVSACEYRRRFPASIDVIARALVRTFGDCDGSSSHVLDSSSHDANLDVDDRVVRAAIDKILVVPRASKLKIPSGQEFIAGLVNNQILHADDIAQLQTRQGPDWTCQDALYLARRLVNAGKLTAFQVSMILKGKLKQLSIGNYRLLDRIGHGGMGDVFKARNPSSNQVVAIKIPSSKRSAPAEALKRFRQEVKVATRLCHPNIVRTIDAEITDRLQYLVMEYIEGTTLDIAIREHGPLPIALALNYTRQVAEGLRYAHNQNVVHRDIKPKNLMLDKSGIVRVLDLGLARALEIVEQTDATQTGRLTRLGEVFGTFDYMSPEQSVDAYGTDGRADVYSLGCTLYFLLTGRPPFIGSSPWDIVKAHQEAFIPYVRAERKDVSEQLDLTVQKMLAKYPDFRQQTMDEVIAAISRCV